MNDLVRIPRRGAPSDIARRTLENPNVPLTGEQLVAVLDVGDSAAGVPVTTERATRQATVISCVKILAETIAMLPLKTFERIQPRGRSVAYAHPTYSLLHDRPNPELPAFIFREVMQAHVGLWGNAFAEIEQNGAGKPLALWPIAPWRVQVVRENGVKVYKVTLNSGEIKPLSADRVMHIPGFGYDGLQGLSPVGVMREAIGLAMATETFGAKFFGNGARPGGIITRPREAPALSPQAAETFKKSWEAAHQGVPNGHRIALLEEGMQWQQMGLPPDDSQFLETRLFEKREIAAWFRVPLHMLGDLERATFSNIEQQGIDFVTHTMGPWLARWESVLNYDLFSDRERASFYAEFVVNGLLRGDAAARSQYYRERFQIGTLSRNDIRELENENPIPGGDTYYVNAATVPLDANGLPIPTPKITEPGVVTPDTPAQEPDTSGATDAARALFRDVGERMARRQVDQLRKAHKKGVSEWDSALETHFSEHTTAIARAISPAIEAVLALTAPSFRAAPKLVALEFASAEVSTMRDLLEKSGHSGAETLLATWETEQSEAFAARAADFLRHFTTARAA